jgi:putative peptidoglycan lipid II flippase
MRHVLRHARCGAGRPVTGPAAPVAAAPPGPPPRGPAIARGAAIIAVLTVAARLCGLLRTVVFAQTVGAGCLGTAYVTAYQVPNVISELILGGALSSALVPVLARPAELSATDPAARARVSQVTSVLLTWAMLLLVPATVVIAALAGPIAGLLDPANSGAHCPHAAVVAVTARMIRVFAPQVLLYGLSFVLSGLLQAYRRFTAPALSPAVTSLALISAYLAFVPLGHGLPLARLPVSAQLALSAGTTAGVAALVAVPLIPAARLRLRLRPALRLPPGTGRLTGGLALVGVIDLVAYELSALVTIALANGRGATGAVVLTSYASQGLSSLHSVLALSIAVSAFPVLSARAGPAFDATCAGSTRAVLLMSWLAAAVLAAIAVPAARVLARQPGQVPELIEGFALLAPAFTGMGLLASLSRAMLAAGRLRVAAVALGGGYLAVTAADVLLAGLAPPRLVVGALSLGYTAGQTAAAAGLLLAVRRIRGPAATAGLRRAGLAGLAAAVAGAGAGAGVSLAIPAGHRLAALAAAVAAAAVAAGAFAVVAAVADRPDLAVVLGRLRRRARA